MSEQQKLVPKLRFPEFRGAVDWEEGKLISLSSEPLSNGVFNDPKKAGAGYKLINVSDMYIETTIDESRLSLLELSQSEFEGNQVFTGDIFFTRSSLVKSGIAVSNIYLGSSGDVTYDGHLIRFRANIIKVIPLFAHYLFKTSPIRAQLIARGKTATMTTIGQADVASVTLFYPKPDEQKHIADCLSSLDELIAAQVRKVEALKTHKKGLMQQLFPREGETQPRLRFPEFLDAGEWEETRLGKLGKLVSGLTYSPDDVREFGLLVLRSSNVQNSEIALDDCVYVDPSIKGANLSQPEDILICVRNGSKALIGKCALIPQGMPLCTHGAFMTVFRADTPSFVFQLFQSDKYQKQVAGDLGATINSINGSQFLKYEFMVPKQVEQKRIADFLVSFDALIFASIQELNTLKTHKKGLMQQLFPSAEAVEA
jgi:type I restriction enzyme S subunit